VSSRIYVEEYGSRAMLARDKCPQIVSVMDVLLALLPPVNDCKIRSLHLSDWKGWSVRLLVTTLRHGWFF
jgi:hypothetical protein